jgi:2-polyprenyl-3-methyl-5-hydroxy-6-metoxy-1,4-benzoquinol methylase
MNTNAVNRVCPLTETAGANRLLPWAPEPWRLKQCEATGFVYLENPPGYEALKEDLAWEVTYENERARKKNAEPLRYQISSVLKTLRARTRRNKVRSLTLQHLNKNPKDAWKVLDVGCAEGAVLLETIAHLPAATRTKCQPYGVELSTQLARSANANFSALNGHCIHNNAIDGIAQFEDSFFDVILLSSFLEHETQPAELLRRCRKHLADDGVVIIKLPNYDSVNRTLRGSRWCGFRWPDHVNYFTPDSLRAMLTKAGLKTRRMNYLDRFPLSDSLYAVAGKG